MASSVTVRFLGDISDLSRALRRADGETQSFGKRIQKGAGIAGAALGGALLIGAKQGISGVLEAVDAEDKFKVALSRSTKSMQAQADALKANASEIQKKTKFTYEDALATDTAIARQESLTGVVDKGLISATELTNRTLDLATAMGTDGPSAANALAKALAKPESASRFLVKAGVDLTTAQEAQLKAMVAAGDTAGAQAFILDRLKKKTDGLAVAAGDTLAGKMERAKNAFGEVEEKLVVGLLPAITSALGALQKVTAWAEANPGKMQAVVAVVGTLAAVLITVGVATKLWAAYQAIASAATAVWTGIQWALNAALIANPIGAVVLAVVALVAVVVLIATKTDWFQKIWGVAWGAIKATFGAVMAVLGAAFGVLKGLFSSAGGAAQALMGKMTGAFDKIKSAAGAIKDAFSSAFGALTGIVKGAINGVIGIIRRFGIPAFKIPIPFAPDISFGGAFPFSGIPMLAKGGIARANKLSIVGEKGPELFMPSQTGRVIPNGTQLSGGGGGTVNLVIDVTGADGEMKSLIKRMVRVEGGGNVQVAFGRK